MYYQWVGGIVFGIECVPEAIANEEGDEWCIAIHIGPLRVFFSKEISE